MIGLLAGLDIGGTKTHIRTEHSDGSTVDVVVPSAGWSASPITDAAQWIGNCIEDNVREPIAALGVGAQGCNTQPQCRALSAALTQRLGVPVEVTNDAALLVPAAGITDGIGVIAGTGAIAVGVLPGGDLAFCGGWGWVLGDEGSAPALVREATRRALADHDAGRDADPLLSLLATGFGVTGAERLARAVNDTPTTESWGARAGIVFQAADRGSESAISVIVAAGAALAALVATLAAKGVPAEHVVIAGSVAVNQPRLLDAFRAALQRAVPTAAVRVLTEPPVAGAIALARRYGMTTDLMNPAGRSAK